MTSKIVFYLNMENGFLVITRKKGQSLLIEKTPGEYIEVAISKIDGEKVAIAIQAPKSVRIHRREAWERKQAEKLSMAHGEL